MVDFYKLSDLPVISEGRRPMQVSSFDRKEENADYDKFLYIDKNGEHIMLDEYGEGAVKSFWAAVTTDETELKFYFDREETPRWVCTLKGFFNGAIPELSGPGNTFEKRGQWELADCRCGNFFIPLHYEKGLKITATGKTDFYYHIMYERYTEDTPEEFKAQGTSKAFLDSFGNAPKKQHPPVTFEKEYSLDNEYNDAFEMNEAGVITEFTLIAPVGTDLSQVKIDMAFDGDTVSYVACPITYLFAETVEFSPIHTKCVDCREEDGNMIMSMYLPIPFWKRVYMCLVNFPKDSTKIKLRMRIEENKYDKDTTGYFHVDYRSGATELFGDWLLCDVSGKGSVVGLIQTCKGGQWCEGNEHFFINGEISPSINGTGTEDVYLGCYWPNLKFDSPVSGCVNNIMIPAENVIKTAYGIKAGYYRFFHDMPLSFDNGIKMTIQHGAVGQTYSEYTSAVMYYKKALPSLKQTDYISLGSDGSIKLHSYKSENREKISLCARVEADRKSPFLSLDGFSHRNGEISFNASVISENHGVWLRRMLDLSGCPTKASVYCDGEFCGIWSDAGNNEFTPFGDSDFYIPERLTMGKDIICVTIKPDGNFTDFEYKVFSKI